MAIPRKGLREIRTLSGRQDRVHLPYQAYMQITCLEMEKARRGSERKSALQRIANLDARLQEIEAEKAALLGALEERNAGNGGKSTGIPNLALKPPHQRGSGGFKLRY